MNLNRRNITHRSLASQRKETKAAEAKKKKSLKKSINQELPYPDAQGNNGGFSSSVFASFAHLRICAGILFILILFSCKSAPKFVNFAEIGSHVPLDPGASVYVVSDVNGARPILDLLPIEELKNSQVKQMIDRTDYFAAALFPVSSGRRFQIAAQGNYPSSGAAIALGINKDWETKSGSAGHSYWLSEKDRLSMALTAKQAFVSASQKDKPGDPVASPPGVKVPDGFVEFMKNAPEKRFPVSCWLDDGGSVINKILGTGSLIRIPVQGIFISFFPVDGDKYQSKIRMRFETAAQARNMANMLSMANNYIFGELGGKAPITSIFFANKPVVKDNNLDITTAQLKESELSLLLRMFLL